MRTELEAVIAGGTVRGVVTVDALLEIAAHRDDYPAVIRRCAVGNVSDIRAVLKAVLRAGGLKPAEVDAEARRLIEEGGLQPCGEWCVSLLTDAFDKAAQAADFPAAEAATASPSADAT